MEKCQEILTKLATRWPPTRRWSKEFLEAGKQRLVGNTKRQATSDDVAGLRRENEQLKQLVAELALKNRVLKKSVLGLENEWDG